MACFSTLPSELQMNIFSYLDPNDLKTARHLCRKCDRNASPALFNRVVVCSRYLALGALKKISLHSVLSKYVRELHFDGSVYHQIIADHERLYCSLEDRYVSDAPGNLFDKRNRWRCYRKLFGDQEAIRGSLTLLHETSRALELLPNVKSVVYSPYPLQVSTEAKLLRYVLPRGITGSHAMGTLNDHAATTEYGIHRLIRAIHQSQYTGIREFKTLAPSLDDPSMARFTMYAFDMDSQFEDAAFFFFRQLDRLELNVSLLYPSGARAAPGDGRKQLATLGALLTAATDLKELTLKFWRWQRSEMHLNENFMNAVFYPFLKLDTSTWTHLQSLSLGGIFAEEEDFTSLIVRHEKLTKLEFSHCSLFHGKWANIVDAVLSQPGITSFSIYRVNETKVAGRSYQILPESTQQLWQYEGELALDANGQRYFNEPLHKTVYANVQYI